MNTARLRQLAGMPERSIQNLANEIFRLAEEQAFDESSEGRRAVSGAQILNEAQRYLAMLEEMVANRVQQEYGIRAVQEEEK